MSKKIITYVLTLAMIFSVFCNPALGYATTEVTTSDVTNTTAAEEPSDDKNTSEKIEEPSDDTEQPEKKPVPAAPAVGKVTGLKASAVSHNKISLSWKKVSGVSGYQVYRYEKSKKKYVLYKTVTKNSYTNTGLKDDTQYCYKVRAYQTQDGKNYYGAFSSVNKCKTQKTDRNKVKSLAYSKRNCQYKYGSKGPKKFDCSGFVYWVYKNAGVKTKKAVPKTSSSGQYSALKKYMIGKSVKSLNKAKVGDIIFFKYGGRISHVGIYYGNGKMIHAANPRKDICIEKVKDYNRLGYKVVGIARVM